MPKTKLDRFTITPTELRSRIIRSSAARIGLPRDGDVAGVMHMSRSCFSQRIHGQKPWDVDELAVLAVRLGLSDEDIVAFVKGRTSSCGKA